MTPDYKSFVLLAKGLGRENARDFLRVGLPDVDVQRGEVGVCPNASIRYTLCGGKRSTKKAAFNMVKDKCVDSYKGKTNHLVLALTVNDVMEVKEMIREGGVPEDAILVVTSSERGRDGRGLRKLLEGWKQGVGTVKIVISTQPISGLNPRFLFECDLLGSWNVITAYQCLTRISRTKDALGTIGNERLHYWRGMFDFLDGQGDEDGDIELPLLLREVYELTTDSYSALWEEEFEGSGTYERCVRERLGWGRSSGGVIRCPEGGQDEGGTEKGVVVNGTGIAEGERVALCTKCLADRFLVSCLDGGGGETGRRESGEKSMEHPTDSPPRPAPGRRGPRERVGGGGGGGSRTAKLVPPTSRTLGTVEIVNAQARGAIGGVTGAFKVGGSGGQRRFWSDGSSWRWICGEVTVSIDVNGVSTTVIEGGCGQLNPLRGKNAFQCSRVSCKMGKSGKKKRINRTEADMNDSFSCGCGKNKGSITFHKESREFLRCNACKEERGERDPEYGYNRGWIINPATGEYDEYLGLFGGVRRWRSGNYKRGKVWLPGER